jgi:hypothetical protein
MPSWVWTSVVLRGSLNDMDEFVQNECHPDTKCCLWNTPLVPAGTTTREHCNTWLGFDGSVTNDHNNQFAFIPVRGSEGIVYMLQAEFETRWDPPLIFFQRMAEKYPKLTIYMKVDHEDDDTYPFGFFQVCPSVPPIIPTIPCAPQLPPPPPSPLNA